MTPIAAETLVARRLAALGAADLAERLGAGSRQLGDARVAMQLGDGSTPGWAEPGRGERGRPRDCGEAATRQVLALRPDLAGRILEALAAPRPLAEISADLALAESCRESLAARQADERASVEARVRVRPPRDLRARQAAELQRIDRASDRQEKRHAEEHAALQVRHAAENAALQASRVAALERHAAELLDQEAEAAEDQERAAARKLAELDVVDRRHAAELARLDAADARLLAEADARAELVKRVVGCTR